MGKVSDDDTAVVLKKLALCFPMFYALYYGSAALMCAILGLFDTPKVFAKMPFALEAFEDFSMANDVTKGARPHAAPPSRAPPPPSSSFANELSLTVGGLPAAIVGYHEPINAYSRSRFFAAAFFSMAMTYVLSIGIIFFIVQSTRKSWDYAVTISFVHWIVCCVVQQSFPTGWVWWVTLVVGTIVVGGFGELFHYKFRDLREIDVDHD